MLDTDTKRPIFTIILLPALLIAMPILTIGVLSFKGLSIEFDSREASRYQNRQELVSKVCTQIIDALIKNAQKKINTIYHSIRDKPLQGIRNLTGNDDILFYTIYQDKDRIFPSAESTSIMHSERFYLNILSNSIRLAFAEFQHNPMYHEQINLTGHEQSTAFVCEQKGNADTICVLLSSDLTRNISRHLLRDFSQVNDNWSITLLKKYTQPLSKVTNKYQTHLPPPLHDIAVELTPPPQALHFSNSFTHTAIIVLPLLALWALLTGFIYKQQYQKIIVNRQRTSTAAQLVHDLRTPLANLLLYADLLYRNANNEKSVRHYAKVIRQESCHLNKLGERTIRAAQGYPEPADYSAIVPLHYIEALVQRSSKLFYSAGCQVHITGTASHEILIDTIVLESITIQLIENAIKHSGSKQIYVHVTFIDELDLLEIQVRDYGKGIPEHLLPHIFDIGISTGKSLKQGYGLGLSSIRYQAQMHGGDAHCENCHPGAKFTITLQVKQVL